MLDQTSSQQCTLKPDVNPSYINKISCYRFENRVYTTKTNRLMTFRVIIVVYSVNHMVPVNNACVKNEVT